MIGDLAPEGIDSTDVQESATEVNKRVGTATDLADAKGKGDEMEKGG